MRDMKDTQRISEVARDGLLSASIRIYKEAENGDYSSNATHGA